MANFCRNYLTIEGPKVTLREFIYENSVDGYLSFEKGVPANLVEKDIYCDDWYEKQMKAWGTRDDILEDNVRGEWVSDEMIIYVFDTRGTPASNWQIDIAIKYPDLIFTTFFYEPGIAFCGYDTSIAGETFKLVINDIDDFKLLCEIFYHTSGFGIFNAIRVLSEFDCKRKTEEEIRQLLNYKEFSNKLITNCCEAKKFKKLDDKNELKSFIKKYSNLFSNDAINISEKVDTKEKVRKFKNKCNCKNRQSMDKNKRSLRTNMNKYVNGNSGFTHDPGPTFDKSI